MTIESLEKQIDIIQKRLDESYCKYDYFEWSYLLNQLKILKGK